MMEVVVTTGAISRAKLQSNHHHQQTNIQFFYRPDALPVAQPTVSNHWREKSITFHGLAYPKLTWGLPRLTTNSSWLPWGRVAMPLISPLMPVPHIQHPDLAQANRWATYRDCPQNWLLFGLFLYLLLGFLVPWLSLSGYLCGLTA